MALVSLSKNVKDPLLILPLLPPLLSNQNEDARVGALEVTLALATNGALPRFPQAHASKLALAALDDDASVVRLQALRVLAALGELPLECSELVIQQLANADDDLRLEACRAIAAISPGNNPNAAGAVASELGEFGSYEQVKEVALLLAKLALPNQDLIATEAFVALAKTQGDTSCRIAALRGIQVAAPFGHEAACEVALDNLHDSDQEIVARAVAALRCIASPENTAVVIGSRDMMSHRGMSLRPEVFASMIGLCPVGDAVVLHALRLGLQHQHWPYRRSVLQAFGALAIRGCPESIEIIKPHLEDPNSDVCCSVVETLIAITLPGDREVIGHLKGIREQKPFAVQIAIDDGIEALEMSNPEPCPDAAASASHYGVSHSQCSLAHAYSSPPHSDACVLGNSDTVDLALCEMTLDVLDDDGSSKPTLSPIFGLGSTEPFGYMSLPLEEPSSVSAGMEIIAADKHVASSSCSR